MALIYYYSMFAISLVMAIIYTFIYHKHFNANLTMLSILVPVINLGFLMMAISKVIEEALIALKITYIGGCFVLVSAMFLILSTCGISVKSWVKTICYAFTTGIYATCLTIGKTNIFYVGIPDLAFTKSGAAYITNKHYGPMHTVFYIMVAVFYLITIAMLIYVLFKKKQVPKQILILIIIALSTAIFGFFGSRLITHEIEILPATYNLGMIIYIIIASRLELYNAPDTVIDSLVQKGDTGFVSFDKHLRYLSSNDTAKRIIPELESLKVDYPVHENEWMNKNFLPWVERFNKDSNDNKHYIKRDNKTYLANISKLIRGKRQAGYQILLTDDTSNQQYIELIKNYNSQLEQQVKEKTKSVIEMQEKLVLGMATMVEGRDNSTGGHIRRTSDVVRFLTDEMKKDTSLNLTNDFYNCLIKAAPMHDLGKITIDDAILRKPGKFTPEEYEIMKSHASEGARIVGQILEGTDDKYFYQIAVNVAHYHHERWDGSGYPKGLKGEDIPFEARIMAIADVYDALVSKRVYKEKMSFEVANNIILESMGKHFDKNLEKYYLAAKGKIEDYYLKNAN